METSGKISFMPKSSFSTGKDYYRKVSSGFLMKISVFLLTISLLAFGGSLLYKRMISQQITDLSASLERAKAAFELSLIAQMENLSFSIPDAGALLGNHLYPTRVFKLVEETTVKDVYFSNFSYSYGKAVGNEKGKTKVVSSEGEQNSIKVQLSGKAKNYEALAQQSDVFNKNKNIEDFSFSNFNLTEKGEVSFSLSLVISEEINK
ncbi:MAG: hypothetical protein PHC85_01380 [Candidatus Pacebacteria bacterium]|nr:hypothetical protein [Candidatus Paceibacterota bacterium]